MVQLLSGVSSQIQAQNQSKTLLIVETDRRLQELLVSSITLFSRYHLTIVGDHVRSLTWVKQVAYNPPDAMIVDIDSVLSLHRAPDFFHTFHDALYQTGLQKIPLLILTTQIEKRTVLEEEGQSVLIKPFKPTMLLHMIHDMIE